MCRETNLKVRQALEETAELSDDHPRMSAFDGKDFIEQSQHCNNVLKYI
jgi:hypothetical protein